MLILFRSICFYSVLLFLLAGCGSDTAESNGNVKSKKGVELIILGTVQDAGSPQIACAKNCCKKLFLNPDSSRRVVSLGIVDYDSETKWLMEATPDIAKQINHLNTYCSFSEKAVPDGILITHAHIGHYTGLMYLGKEAMNANNVPVYAMPKMSDFLKSNGPWSQLVENENIKISPINADLEIKLSKNITVIPIKVPHRDEFSETVGFKIIGPAKKVLFIPDIDKWQKWDKSIVDEVKACDYAFIDATFFDSEEINNRNIAEIPHPFVIESIELFKGLNEKDKAKIHFIHFNHTNPLLMDAHEKTKAVFKNGFRVSKLNQVFKL